MIEDAKKTRLRKKSNSIESNESIDRDEMKIHELKI